MVAAAAIPRPMTYEEYAALPDDGRRYELLNGQLVVAAAPNGKPLMASKRYYDELNACVEPRELGVVFLCALWVDVFRVRRGPTRSVLRQS
ncbi:MAG: hypothetical protein QOF33_1480, partial [Thermomicrobiales bacterium]|nr:hypothetical protein [Thermomicrobiales bacterium]